MVYEQTMKRAKTILKNIDSVINNAYEYNEEYLLQLSIFYTTKFIENKTHTYNDIRNICGVCYFLAMKWLLDNHPELTEYLDIIVIKDREKFKELEFDIAVAFDFNFNTTLNELKHLTLV